MSSHNLFTDIVKYSTLNIVVFFNLSTFHNGFCLCYTAANAALQAQAAADDVLLGMQQGIDGGMNVVQLLHAALAGTTPLY